MTDIQLRHDANPLPDAAHSATPADFRRKALVSAGNLAATLALTIERVHAGRYENAAMSARLVVMHAKLAMAAADAAEAMEPVVVAASRAA